MGSFSSPRRTLTGAAIVALLGVWTAIGHSQVQPSQISKTLIQDFALPAIDRGLRDQDAPRAPRTGARADHVRGPQGEPLSYLRESIIVKFKDDVSRGAIGAATAQVSGGIVDRTSWADFDIVGIPSNVDPEAAAAAMRARPDVEYAQP